MQVYDHAIEDDLKKLIITTYMNEMMHILFGDSSFQNFIVKHV